MTKMWDDPVSAADMADEHAALIMARDAMRAERDEARAERDQARDAQHQAELRGLRWQKLAGTLAQTIADLTANTAVDQ